MVWLGGKCCSNAINSNNNINGLMGYDVEFYVKKINTSISNQIQKNTISSNLVLQKKCYIKDRSTASYEENIIAGIKDGNNSKELILSYFDINNIDFNKAICLGSTYDVLGVSKLSQVRLDGVLYKANQFTPFISVIIGLKKI
jgi:hypothetical protein